MKEPLGPYSDLRLELDSCSSVKYCSRNAWVSNAQVSNWYSSMFHNRYLLESILKPQVHMERMSYWHNFIKKGELLLFCLLPALWKLFRIENTYLSHLSHVKTNTMTCVPSEDSDQPGHPPGLIRVFAVRSMVSLGPNVSSCGQRRLIRLGGCPGWSASSLCTFLSKSTAKTDQTVDAQANQSS